MGRDPRPWLDALGIPVWVPKVVAPVPEPPLPAERKMRQQAGEEGAGMAGPTAEPAAVQARAAPSVMVRDAETADLIRSWDDLRAEVAACTACELHATRTQTVFGVGDTAAPWLFVGEGPGAEEDRQGEPFVGPAGQLLNAMLRAMGLLREQVYITNIVKCRPPGNREPRPEEAAACAGFLQRQIDLLRPRVIVALGRVAAQNLLRTESPLARLRGRVHHFGTAQTPLVVTYHPAYLLRTPSDKARAWEDLCLALRTFRAAGA